MLKILFLIIILYSSIQFQKDYRLKDGWTGSPLPIYSGLHYRIKNRNAENYLSTSFSMDTIAIVKPPREKEKFLHIFDEITVNYQEAPENNRKRIRYKSIEIKYL